MTYMVPTGSDERYKALMHFLDKVEEVMRQRELNNSEYQSLVEFKLKVNSMRFGAKPELEYPHWAEIYNRAQQLLDQPRRVPIAGGPPSQRHHAEADREEENVVTDFYKEEFDDLEVPDHPTHPHGDSDHVENE